MVMALDFTFMARLIIEDKMGGKIRAKHHKNGGALIFNIGSQKEER